MFLSSPEFEDLRKYELSNEEWNALVIAREILLVSLSLPLSNFNTNSNFQVPFAFQQKLSAHKTPTLCDAIPSFEAMITIWTEMQENAQPSESLVIQEGLDKLAVYRDRTNLVPAYAIAMSMFILSGVSDHIELN